VSSGLSNLHKIRLIAFDIDGVFTDGRFYLSDDGVETKAFHTQDGYGVRRLLDAGMAVGAISGRHSTAVEKRMAELGVQHVILGCKDKVAAMDELAAALSIPVTACAYVGDDLPDLPLLEHVGFSVAVANAVPALREYCDYVTTKPGGFGAVREICDLLVTAADRDS
jgi:3-deoxy-D-manno-octulosonate 8-phosphate phosphatase (KDO 8-P phosphatase)